MVKNAWNTTETIKPLSYDDFTSGNLLHLERQENILHTEEIPICSFVYPFIGSNTNNAYFSTCIYSYVFSK